MKVDLSTAPTTRGPRVNPCELSAWLLDVDEAQRPEVVDVIYKGGGSHEAVGAWLSSNGLGGNTSQMVGRHRRKPCPSCAMAGLL